MRSNARRRSASCSANDGGPTLGSFFGHTLICDRQAGLARIDTDISPVTSEAQLLSSRRRLRQDCGRPTTDEAKGDGGSPRQRLLHGLTFAFGGPNLGLGLGTSKRRVHERRIRRRCDGLCRTGRWRGRGGRGRSGSRSLGRRRSRRVGFVAHSHTTLFRMQAAARSTPPAARSEIWNFRPRLFRSTVGTLCFHPCVRVDRISGRVSSG